MLYFYTPHSSKINEYAHLFIKTISGTHMLSVFKNRSVTLSASLAFHASRSSVQRCYHEIRQKLSQVSEVMHTFYECIDSILLNQGCAIIKMASAI